MDIEWAQALRTSLTQVCSTMFFMVPESDPELVQALAGHSAQGWCEGGVLFIVEGRRVVVMVWAPPSLAADPKALTENDILDAFKEMLNMVAGGLLTSVDPEMTQPMGLPMGWVITGGTIKSALARASKTMAYEVEGWPLLARLSQG